MSRIWDKDNLYAWCVVPFDELKRGPEARAQMMADLGIHKFAYDWRDENIPEFGDELDALNRHGIALVSWWWSQEHDEETRTYTLDTFARHGVHPRLWVMQGENVYPDNVPTTAEQQRDRVEIEAQRIKRIADFVGSYGIDLYGHNDWLGIPDNEIAVIDRARELGVKDIGICYNFSHARDDVHDDTVDFPALWARMQPYVNSVNIAGTHFEDGTTLFPGDGQHDLEMMRTIENSRWRGPVGIIAETGGDAKVSLETALERVAWLMTELDAPGFAGPQDSG